MDLQRWDRAKELVGNTFELTALIRFDCQAFRKLTSPSTRLGLIPD